MGTKTYNRLKDPDTNSTGIVLSGEVRELPNALAAVVAGTSGDFELAISGDADESGGADVQQLYRVLAQPIIAAGAPGQQSLRVTITPVLGDGSDGTPIITDVPHPETMDAWQTAAGRPRQP